MSVSDRATRRDLRALFEPESVAVVGASDDPEKWGNWLARGALRGASRRAVHLVNRRGGEVMGRPAHRSLTELPEAPELAVLAVPPAALAGAVDDAIAAGCRALVVITAGQTDGDAGGPRDAALARQARDAGVILLGPNCLGVFDAGAELELVSNDLPRGSLGLISQSGNLALEIGLLAGAAGLGFSRFVSVGNQADLEAGELIGELAAHDGTDLIAIYVEDFRDGRSFARAAEAATRAGKPVVLLAVEHTDATARAVRSHTGALASDSAAIDAACRAAGMERVRSPQGLVDLAQGLMRAGVPRGRRVAVLADGGGHGGVAAALASEAALAIPALSEGLRRELRAGLPPTAAVANPIDLAGGGEADIHSFERTARAVLGSGEVDAVLMTGYFGGYSDYAETLGRAEAAVAEALADAADATGRPLVVQTMHPQTAAASTLRSRGVPVYRTIERAVGVLARLAEAGEREPRGVPELPEAAVAVMPLPEAAVAVAAPGLPARQAASSQGEASRAPASAYSGARALLGAGGVPFVPAREVSSPDEAAAAAAELGYPVVLKALGLLHKSDLGGVVTGVADEPTLRATFADLEERLAPPAFSVESMAPVGDGVELLVGARWDARFGPVALVGVGGVFTEVLSDVAVALAPVDEATARELLLSLRAAPLLQGARGRRALDIDAAASAVAALSRVAAAHPEIAEIEVNPLLALTEGVVALDARAVPWWQNGSQEEANASRD
jgi:acetate---CoA ligase (ADP-forming)